MNNKYACVGKTIIGVPIFIYSCSAWLISFEIDCLNNLLTGSSRVNVAVEINHKEVELRGDNYIDIFWQMAMTALEKFLENKKDWTSVT